MNIALYVIAIMIIALTVYGTYLAAKYDDPLDWDEEDDTQGD